GWTEGDVPQLVVRRYLSPFFGEDRGAFLPRDSRVGCVVLGCTHFPPFRPLIEAELEQLGGRGIPVVDSAEQTALDVQGFLNQRGMAAARERRGQLRILV